MSTTLTLTLAILRYIVRELMDEKDVLVFPFGHEAVTTLTDGSLFPSKAVFHLVRESDPTSPFVRLGLDVMNGAVTVAFFGIQVSAGGRGVSASDDRWWNFDKCVRLAMRAGAVGAYVRTVEAEGGMTTLGARLDVEAKAPENWSVRRSLSDEFLAEVAEVARKNPRRRTMAVVEHFGGSVSHRNASRWIKAAQQRGLPLVEKGQ